jgi:alkaline phosphatase D
LQRQRKVLSERGASGRASLTRRQLLRGSALALALGACGDDLSPRRPGPGGWQTPGLPPVGPEGGLFPDEVTEATLSTFPLGVSSGDVGKEATLWTQYRGIAGLHLAVWEVLPDESYSDLVIWSEVRPSGEGFVHVEVGHLVPGARHVFAFVETRDGAPLSRSPLGCFRAALADDELVPLRLGASSCTDHNFAFETIARAAGRDDLDLYLLLGDTMYSGGTTSRDGFRSRWARDLSTSAYRELRRTSSVLATWDDHEVANNWDPETLAPAVFGEAASAFFDHLPIGRAARAAGRIWRSTRWGRTAEIGRASCRERVS